CDTAIACSLITSHATTIVLLSLHAALPILPLARYACSARPLRPGAWPSAGSFRCSAIATFSSVVSSPATTSGKLITSATPTTRGWRSNLSIASSGNSAPAVSNPLLGTQLGTVTHTSNGSPVVESRSHSTPFSPATLAISWGSHTTPVTPRGSTARAYPSGVTSDDSRWTWPTMRPAPS